MPSKYPPTERTTAGRLAVGDELLIRDRRSDQPLGSGSGDPFPPGVWTVLAVTSTMDHRGRRAQRTYAVTVEHPGAGERTFHTSPAQRFNRLASGAA